MFDSLKRYLVHWYDLNVVGCHEPILRPPQNAGKTLDMSCLVLCRDDKAVYKALAQSYLNGQRVFVINNKSAKPKAHVELIKKGIKKFARLHDAYVQMEL